MFRLDICVARALAAADARAASGDYLARALGRPPRWADRWAQFHCFATCVLDRVFLLNDRSALFEIAGPSPERVAALLPAGSGCLVFGAPLGSFELLRTLARVREDVRVSLLMYEENARKTGAVLHAINPAAGLDVIALGQPGAMLTVAARLAAGGIVGLLADRGLDARTMAPVDFLGAPAAFPVGPFRMACLLRRPVVLMLGLYRGGNRYEIVLEPLADWSGEPPGAADLMRRYAERLAFHCRRAPYNWFNFYRFWA